MDFTKYDVSLKIRPYGLEKLFALLPQYGIEAVDVEELRVYRLNRPGVKDDHFRPSLRVSFLIDHEEMGMVNSLRAQLDAETVNYFDDLIVTPVLRHLPKARIHLQHHNKDVANG